MQNLGNAMENLNIAMQKLGNIPGIEPQFHRHSERRPVPHCNSISFENILIQQAVSSNCKKSQYHLEKSFQKQ